jgi:hypothetical protein
MNQAKESSTDLPQPLRAVASALHRLPGAEQVNVIADRALDWIAGISPRDRRMAVYTGAGVLGVAGVVEWPVALTGAAVAWLTQPRARQSEHPPGDMTKDGRQPVVADTASAVSGTTDAGPFGPGDKLAPSHFHHDRPAQRPHEQPAKVGDPATASALKQVAEASVHHAEPHPSDGRSQGRT